MPVSNNPEGRELELHRRVEVILNAAAVWMLSILTKQDSELSEETKRFAQARANKAVASIAIEIDGFPELDPVREAMKMANTQDPLHPDNLLPVETIVLLMEARQG